MNFGNLYNKEVAIQQDNVDVVKRVAFSGTLLGLAAALPGVDFLKIGPFRIWHIFVIVAFIFAINSVGFEEIKKLRISKIEWGLFTFVLACTINEVYNGYYLNFAPNIPNTLATLFYFLAYLAARISLTGASAAMPVFLTRFIIPAIPMGMISVGQLVSNDFAYVTLSIASGDGLENRLNASGMVRSAALFGHWTGAGFYFVVMFAAALILVRYKVNVTIAILAMVSATLGCVATLTFSVLISLGALFLIAIFHSKYRIAVIIGVCLVSILAWPIFEAPLEERVQEQSVGGYGNAPEWLPSTLQYRWGVWERQTIPAILERPMNGWGAAVYTDTSTSERVRPDGALWGSAESQWFYILVTQGILIFTLFLMLLFAVFGFLKRLKFSHPILYSPMMVLFMMSVLSSFTVPVFTNRGFPTAFWPLIGAVYAVAQSKKEPRSTISSL